jgi:hypothetical protein
LVGVAADTQHFIKISLCHRPVYLPTTTLA